LRWIDRVLALLPVCLLAAYATWIYLAPSDIVAARITNPYRVFKARNDPALTAQIGERATRESISAVAVMIWNRGRGSTGNAKSATVVLNPPRRILATRTLASPRREAEIAIDMSAASSGRLTISWKQLAPRDGIALHIAYEGWGAGVEVRTLPTTTYWPANPRESHTLAIVSLLMGTFMSWFLLAQRRDESFRMASTGCLGLFVLWFWGITAYYAAGYIQMPPPKLRAAIAERYPQKTLWPGGLH
jgi:hypothetical protein